MFTLRNLTRYGNNYPRRREHAAAPGDHRRESGLDRSGLQPGAFQMRRTDTKYQYRNDKVTTNQTDLSSEFQHRPRVAQRRHRPRVRGRSAADLRVHRHVRQRPAAGHRSGSTRIRSSPTRPTYAKTGATSNARRQLDGALRVRHGASSTSSGRPTSASATTTSRSTTRRCRPPASWPTSAAPTTPRPAAPAWSTSRSRRAASTPRSAPRSRRSTTRRTG